MAEVRESQEIARRWEGRACSKAGCGSDVRRRLKAEGDLDGFKDESKLMVVGWG